MNEVHEVQGNGNYALLLLNKIIFTEIALSSTLERVRAVLVSYVIATDGTVVSKLKNAIAYLWYVQSGPIFLEPPVDSMLLVRRRKICHFHLKILYRNLRKINSLRISTHQDKSYHSSLVNYMSHGIAINHYCTRVSIIKIWLHIWATLIYNWDVTTCIRFEKGARSL